MTSFANVERLSVGDQTPSFEHTFTALDLFAYAAATWDWARIHFDQDYARALNFPDTFVDGQHYGALFSKSVVDWLGPRAFITRMKFNFRTITFRNETVTGTGSISDLARVDDAVTITVTQELHKGAKLVATGMTTARIPRPAP